MSPTLRAIAVAALLCLPPAGVGAAPATPRFTGEGVFTLDCRGTATANGVATADTRSYAVDTRRCAVEPWPGTQCRCVDEIISCDSGGAGGAHDVVINRTTTKVVEGRPDWRFEGRCRRRAP